MSLRTLVTNLADRESYCNPVSPEGTFAFLPTAMAARKDDPSEGDAGQGGPAETLKGVGLRTDYWLLVLENELGVTGTQALRHLKDEDYLKLASDAQYTWEKKALTVPQAHGKARVPARTLHPPDIPAWTRGQPARWLFQLEVCW